jgi:thiamine-monophosphate kinase
MGTEDRGGAATAGGDAPRVADLGEFALIDRLARLLRDGDVDPLRPPATGDVAIGDDAATWTPTPGWTELLTTDALVENVHFKLTTTGWHDLGWKALAVNVSDVAAMGGHPRRAFVTIGVPASTRVADLEALYGGLRELAAEFGVEIVGGDTVSAPLTILSVSVVGEVDGSGLRRAGGQPGDLVAVTGALGGSAGGLDLLEAGLTEPETETERVLLERHRRPWPRVREALILARRGVRCGMDLSDGLRGDAGKLAYASAVGIRLSVADVPVDPALAERFGERAREMALGGGEDYELLVAAPRELLSEAQHELAEARLAPLTIVGRLADDAPGRVRIVDDNGAEIAAAGRSWDHFAASEGTE